MKYSIVIIAIIFAYCNAAPSLETKVKQYMKDSVVPRFDDPASYQFVSMEKPDSISNHYVILSEKQKYLEDLQKENDKMHANNLEMISDKMESTGTALDNKILQNGKHIDSLCKAYISLLNTQITRCDNDLLKPDSLNHLGIKVNYRGKNKMGALILDNITLRYFPKENKITEAQ